MKNTLQNWFFSVCMVLEWFSSEQNKQRAIHIFYIIKLSTWSRLLKCFCISTEGAHNPEKLCNHDYNWQAQGGSELRGSHLIKQTNTHTGNWQQVAQLISFWFLSCMTKVNYESIYKLHEKFMHFFQIGESNSKIRLELCNREIEKNHN